MPKVSKLVLNDEVCEISDSYAREQLENKIETISIDNVPVEKNNKNVNLPPYPTKESLGLADVENKSSEQIRSEMTAQDVTAALGYTPANEAEKGQPNGVAQLDETGKVPSSQLPSYVDDVVPYDNKEEFPITGESGKIYIDKTTNITYRWDGSDYVEISPSIAIGTTAATAFAGDKGQEAYTHAVTNKGSAFEQGLYKITTNEEGHVVNATSVTKSDILDLGIEDEDSKVTSVENHYTPFADASAAISAQASGGTSAQWNVTNFVTGITLSRDAAGHVTNIEVDSSRMPVKPEGGESGGETYIIETGDENGQIKVLPSDSDAYNVNVKGLGSAAFTNSEDYATMAQGQKADSAIQTVKIGNEEIVDEDGNITLPEYPTKESLGLGKVENKTAQDIVDGITSEDIIEKLGYTPATAAQGEKADNSVQTVKIGEETIQNNNGVVTLPTYPTKESLGLGEVENKTSAEIREEIDSENVINALGYTPATASQGEKADTAVQTIKIGAEIIEKVAGVVTLPEYPTKESLGLDNVGNYKALSVEQQELTEEEKQNARDNIGAGTSNFDGDYNSLDNTPQLGSAATKEAPTSGNASAEQVVLGNDSRLTDARPASDVSDWAKQPEKPTYTAAEVGAISTEQKGSANGIAELDDSGKVLSSQLPSYVDDVIEVDTYEDLPILGESGKIYITTDTNQTYRWTGSVYVEISSSSSLVLGETSSTAYRGDRGKIAYDFSQAEHARVDATKVEASETNGNIKINDVETKVYTPSSTDVTAALGYTPATAAQGSKADTAVQNVSIDGDIQTKTKGVVDLPAYPTKASLGLGNVENKSSATIRGELTSTNVTNALGYTPATATQGEKADAATTTIKIGSTSYSPSDGIVTLPSYPTVPASLKNPYSLTIQGDGTKAFDYDGSSAKTLNIKAGTNITMSTETNGNITINGTGDTNTTYTVASGDNNGQIKIAPSTGTAYNVNVKGLGSAAYTDSSEYVSSDTLNNYLPLSGGTMTGNVTVNVNSANKKIVSSDSGASIEIGKITDTQVWKQGEVKITSGDYDKKRGNYLWIDSSGLTFAYDRRDYGSNYGTLNIGSLNYFDNGLSSFEFKSPMVFSDEVDFNGTVNLSNKRLYAETIRYDTGAQGLTSTQKTNARTNIGLGSASTYDATTSVTSGNGNLVTSGAVYNVLSAKQDKISSSTYGVATYVSNSFFTSSQISGVAYRNYNGLFAFLVFNINVGSATATDFVTVAKLPFKAVLSTMQVIPIQNSSDNVTLHIGTNSDEIKLYKNNSTAGWVRTSLFIPIV